MSESNWNDWSGRVLKLLAPILVGWLVGSLMNLSGEREKTLANAEAIRQLQGQVSELSKTYATNKTVDDLREEMRSNYRDLSAKMDQVVKILLERR